MLKLYLAIGAKKLPERSSTDAPEARHGESRKNSFFSSDLSYKTAISQASITSVDIRVNKSVKLNQTKPKLL